MAHIRIPAVFMRGGTSKAVVFKAGDLPADRAARDAIFVRALGSPDPYGRQLDGMGGGLSSLSKAVIVEPSTRPGVDVDYTFIQVAVDAPVADYGSMCGNMSASIGPFAVDEGMLAAPENGEALVRVFNTNTNKIFHARFQTRGGKAVESGDFEIPGVSGAGACIRLDNLDPGGATTGRLLPSGAARDWLDVPGVGRIEASLVDASNPVAFVRAADLGASGLEHPAAIDADRALMNRLEAVRRAASVRMGLSATAESAKLSNPKVAMLAAPGAFTALDGRDYPAGSYSFSVRIISMGNCHRAITLTGGMCAAVAARIPGSLAHDLMDSGAQVRIGNPSGVLPVDAEVRPGADGPHAIRATTYRTQRRLMEGWITLPCDAPDAIA